MPQMQWLTHQSQWLTWCCTLVILIVARTFYLQGDSGVEALVALEVDKGEWHMLSKECDETPIPVSWTLGTSSAGWASVFTGTETCGEMSAAEMESCVWMASARVMVVISHRVPLFHQPCPPDSHPSVSRTVTTLNCHHWPCMCTGFS